MDEEISGGFISIDNNIPPPLNAKGVILCSLFILFMIVASREME